MWALQAIYMLVFLATASLSIVLAYQTMPEQRPLVVSMLAVTPILLGVCAVACAQAVRTFGHIVRDLQRLQIEASAAAERG